MSTAEIALEFYARLVKHATMLFHGVAHVLVVERLLDAPIISKDHGRLCLSFQSDEALATSLNLEQAFTRRLLRDLEVDGLASSKKMRLSSKNSELQASSYGDAHEHSTVSWGIDFHLAVDVIEYKLHHMDEKIKKMRTPSTTPVYLCPVCRAEFSLSQITSVKFDNSTGDALCPSPRPACDGQRLVDRGGVGPPQAVVDYADNILREETSTLRQLVREVEGCKATPVYRLPNSKSPTSDAVIEQGPSTTDQDIASLPDLRPCPPWFTSGYAGASSSSTAVEDTTQDDADDADDADDGLDSERAFGDAPAPHVKRAASSKARFLLSVGHTHVFLPDETYDKGTDMWTKRCACGFKVEYERI